MARLTYDYSLRELDIMIPLYVQTDLKNDRRNEWVTSGIRSVYNCDCFYNCMNSHRLPKFTFKGYLLNLPEKTSFIVHSMQNICVNDSIMTYY